MRRLTRTHPGQTEERGPLLRVGAGVALALVLSACANTVPSQRTRAFPEQGQELSQYKEDSWTCDNHAVRKSDNVSSYWWAGIIGLAIAKSAIEQKEDVMWRACMEAKRYKVSSE
jgi:hypothetical protein